MKDTRLQGIALLLMQNNLLDLENAIVYQHAAAKQKQSLLQYLAHHHIIPSEAIASSVAKHFSLSRFDLDKIDVGSIPTALVNERLMHTHRIVPLFHQGHQLHIAMDDPDQQDALKEIQFHTGLHVVPLVVEADKLTRLMNQLLHQKENKSLADLITDSHPDDSSDPSREDQPVVKFVKRMITDAIEKGASDIHFEPYEQAYRIRYRQDGLLLTVASPPLTLSARIAARIKIMANLDISERRIPQDGRFRMHISHTQTIDFRVSTCPTVGGEKIALRILDTQSVRPEINTLGFTSQQKITFLQALSRPQGMILVTGPTGSGKSMTLYSALNILNTGDKNLYTAEDPVEINVHGINQVNINPKAGLTFAATLRAFLRQDPDVIMIGEIRDLETAEMAVKAAQTGHFVLSTIHTNSAAETLSRLSNMGLSFFNIASSVSLIVAQRLIRRLCAACKVKRNDLTSSILTDLGFIHTDNDILQSYKAQGCHQCTDGYRGRMGLFEVMPISKNMTHMMMSGGNAYDLLQLAQEEGMLTLFQTGIEKIKAGLTSIEELTRVMVD